MAKGREDYQEVLIVEERLKSSMELSFEKVQADMKQLQQWQQFLINDTHELRSDLEDLRQDSITTEKFNLLKIHIQEVKESLKKREDLQQQLQTGIEELQRDTVTNKEFHEQIDNLRASTENLEEQQKRKVSDVQFQKLVGEINKELDNVKQDMGYVEARGGKVVDARMNHFMAQFNEKVNELKQQVIQYRDENTRFMKKHQGEELVQDVNREFNNLKEVVEDLAERLRLSEERVRRLRKKSDDGDVKEAQSQKQEAAMKAKLFSLSSTSSKNWLMITSYILIGLAFASLIASIVSFIANALPLIDWFVVLAIILFITGIVLRIVGLLRKKQ